MSRRKSKRVQLPRVTVLAYDRRDLVAFASAVDKVISTQHELERMLGELRDQVAALSSPAKKAWQTRRRRAAAAEGGGQ